MESPSAEPEVSFLKGRVRTAPIAALDRPGEDREVQRKKIPAPLPSEPHTNAPPYPHRKPLSLLFGFRR
jgi:hypothetical protein